jgi:hypothetical protein
MYYENADGKSQPDCFEDPLMNWPSELQNHCAYMGVRDQLHPDLLRDGANGDGAMEFVVNDWRSQP